MRRFSQILVMIISIFGVGFFSMAAFAQPEPPDDTAPSDDAAQSDGEGILGPPASNVLGAEDIWANPSFTGGTGNNGETAHSEW